MVFILLIHPPRPPYPYVYATQSPVVEKIRSGVPSLLDGGASRLIVWHKVVKEQVFSTEEADVHIMITGKVANMKTLIATNKIYARALGMGLQEVRIMDSRLMSDWRRFLAVGGGLGGGPRQKVKSGPKVANTDSSRARIPGQVPLQILL